MDIGPAELVVALVTIMLVFGPSRLPRTARAIGQSLTEARRGTAGAPEPSPGVAAFGAVHR